MAAIKGIRCYPDSQGCLWLPSGGYGQRTDGIWEIRPPGCHLGELTEHTVTEHDDGTITVEPSIRSEWGDRHETLWTERDDSKVHYWHGYLIRGEWRRT